MAHVSRLQALPFPSTGFTFPFYRLYLSLLQAFLHGVLPLCAGATASSRHLLSAIALTWSANLLWRELTWSGLCSSVWKHAFWYALAVSVGLNRIWPA